jgi:hypothetical protein
MYLRINEENNIQYPYGLFLFRQDFPNSSPPKSFDEMSEENREYFGIYSVISTEEPIADVVEEGTPEFIEGQWIQTWTAREFTQEEIDEQLAQKRAMMSVTMRQGRLVLNSMGLLDMIEDAIASIEDPVDRKNAEIEWEYAQTIDRNSKFVKDIIDQLNLTEEQVDQMFELASTL